MLTKQNQKERRRRDMTPTKITSKLSNNRTEKKGKLEKVGKIEKRML